jgi:hypothetical protein
MENLQVTMVGTHRSRRDKTAQKDILVVRRHLVGTQMDIGPFCSPSVHKYPATSSMFVRRNRYEIEMCRIGGGYSRRCSSGL